MPQLYLRVKYPLRFFVYYVHAVTQQCKSRSTSVIKVATMKNTIVPRTPVIVWNWSIHCPYLSAMFNLLHSSMNQELFEKYVCNQSSHYKKYNGAAYPSYRLKLNYPLILSVCYVQLVTQQYELFGKHLYNQGSHYEKYGWFPLCKGSHHMQPLN